MSKKQEINLSEGEALWFVYLLRTASGSLYTGISTDVARRFLEHQSGGRLAAKSLRGRGPLQLAFSTPAGNRSVALALEARIKRLSKQEKERLVAGELSINQV